MEHHGGEKSFIPSWHEGRIYIPSARQSVSLGRNGNEDRLFFREKVFLSEIVGKKDRLSNRAEQLSNRAERLSTRAKRG